MRPSRVLSAESKCSFSRSWWVCTAAQTRSIDFLTDAVILGAVGAGSRRDTGSEVVALDDAAPPAAPLALPAAWGAGAVGVAASTTAAVGGERSS